MFPHVAYDLLHPYGNTVMHRLIRLGDSWAIPPHRRRIFVDVGAAGYGPSDSAAVVKRTERFKVYALEPVQQQMEAIVNEIPEGQRDRVKVFRRVLATENRTYAVYEQNSDGHKGPGNTFGTQHPPWLIGKPQKPRFTVGGITWPMLVEEHIKLEPGERVFLLKIDCEGCEPPTFSRYGVQMARQVRFLLFEYALFWNSRYSKKHLGEPGRGKQWAKIKPRTAYDLPAFNRTLWGVTELLWAHGMMTCLIAMENLLLPVGGPFWTSAYELCDASRGRDPCVYNMLAFRVDDPVTRAIIESEHPRTAALLQTADIWVGRQ